MKTLVAVILSALVGVALGACTTWARYYQAPEAVLARIPQIAGKTIIPPGASQGAVAKVVVPETDFDFGTIGQSSITPHAFRFINEGSAPLVLRSGGTTCGKCTISELPKEAIPPGSSAEVNVQYHSGSEEAPFRQSATIFTNDPLMPSVLLTISGRVAKEVVVTPTQIVFSKLSASEPRTASARVVSRLTDDFAIDSFEHLPAEMASHFEVAIVPIPADKLTESDAKRGYEVKVTAKRGMPLGPFQDILELKTTSQVQPTVSIPIQGNVESDISISGLNYHPESGTLYLDRVDSRKGKERKLLVLVRGDKRQDVHVEVAKCEPSFLQAKLGEPASMNNAAVVRIPLVITIPPGAPEANYLAPPATITLKSTHPDVPEISLRVKFVVVQGS